ncbi:UNVERIFIED_CONTAM: hypothetical protein Sradi_5828000 [Sesamum radiatum]|uniref:DUF8040 domain-containing protein n=1 Tax=Sesamum radiatum TaxID=300843 RepID=A0AAW2KSN4_SESRA
MNSTICPSYVFTQEQLKGKLNMMRRAWRLLNDLLHKGTWCGWDHEWNTITDESGRLQELCRMFARNTAIGGIARSSAHPPPGFQTASLGDEEQMTGGNSGSRRSREDYEDTTFSQSQPMSTPNGYFSNTPTQSFTSPSSSSAQQGAGTMASASKGTANETNSSSGTPATPGTPGSTESDAPEEFYAFRDLICPELFREKVHRNTSAVQGEGWVAKIMATPHTGKFYDNIRMTKSCFYTLVDALTSRGLLPHGQTSRVSSIEEVALFMQMVGMHKRQRDNMERFQHSLETVNRRFHRVLSALCTMAPELITRPNFKDIHSRVASNIDFYPYFKV